MSMRGQSIEKMVGVKGEGIEERERREEERERERISQV